EAVDRVLRLDDPRADRFRARRAALGLPVPARETARDTALVEPVGRRPGRRLSGPGRHAAADVHLVGYRRALRGAGAVLRRHDVSEGLPDDPPGLGDLPRP